MCARRGCAYRREVEDVFGELVRGGAAVHGHGVAVALHAAGRVDGVAEEAVAGALGADHAWTGSGHQGVRNAARGTVQGKEKQREKKTLTGLVFGSSTVVRMWGRRECGHQGAGSLERKRIWQCENVNLTYIGP